MSKFTSYHARTTWEAEQKIAASKPAAVILDVVLDGEDSWDLLASIKRNPETANIPVIVVSATDDAAKGFHLGADHYLVKPISREILAERVRSVTSRPRRGRVLIIDDEEKDRYFLKRALRDTGVEVGDAASGPEGIARAFADSPDMIILDLGMPEMDGFQVLRALRGDSRTSKVPVVINTSMALTQAQINELACQAAAIVSKEQFSRGEGLEQLRRIVVENMTATS